MYFFLILSNLLFFQPVTNILEYQENKFLSSEHKNCANDNLEN